MKKLLFGLIATITFGINSYSQDKMEKIIDTNSIEIEKEYDETVRLSCTRINIGINILIAWASTDIYIGCGFPGDHMYPTGCRPISQKLCNIIDSYSNRTSDYVLNVKDFFKDTDCSKVTELEITQSSDWLDENGKTLTIKLGKYIVEKNGNFNLKIVNK